MSDTSRRVTEEFRRLGVFGDWQHPYLTMNFRYQATIARALGKFVEIEGPDEASVLKDLNETAARPAIDSVLLIAFGGPTKREEIRPFLENVTRGRGIPDERLEEMLSGRDRGEQHLGHADG